MNQHIAHNRAIYQEEIDLILYICVGTDSDTNCGDAAQYLPPPQYTHSLPAAGTQQQKLLVGHLLLVSGTHMLVSGTHRQEKVHLSVLYIQ